MSHSIAFDLHQDTRSPHPRAAARLSAGGWSQRRKLLCTATLSVAAWLVVLSPLVL
jgi:hypothetical protein